MNFMETVNQQCITTTINQNRHGTAILLLEHAHPVRLRRLRTLVVNLRILYLSVHRSLRSWTNALRIWSTVAQLVNCRADNKLITRAARLVKRAD